MDDNLNSRKAFVEANGVGTEESGEEPLGGLNKQVFPFVTVIFCLLVAGLSGRTWT